MRYIHSPGLIGIPPKGNSDFDMHCFMSYKDVSLPKPVRNSEKKKKRGEGWGQRARIWIGRNGKRFLVTAVHNLL